MAIAATGRKDDTAVDGKPIRGAICSSEVGMTR
jgi:hypothetical protein